MDIPEGYRRLEGSEFRPAADARQIGAEDPGKPLSVTIRVRQAAGEPGRDQVADFARGHGLRVDRTTATDEIIVSGTVAQINAAFGIELGLYAWRARTYRGCTGFLYLPGEIAELIGSVLGLIEHGAGAGCPWCAPGPCGPEGSRGHSHGGSAGDRKPRLRVIADWTVPNAGPSGPVSPANYAMVSSFDIDWLNTPGFQAMLDNLAASPGAFKTVRVMKVLSSGTAELGVALPAPDSVWAYNAAGPVPIPADAFSATISGLTELTQRGLVPYVVLGFFPAGVYSGTTAGLPTGAPYQYGPSAPDPQDWTTILQNWTTLVQAFFNQLYATFGSAISEWWFEVWNEPDDYYSSWLPDKAAPDVPPAEGYLYYYCQLYQETVSAIASTGLPDSVKVRVGGPAIMANSTLLNRGGFYPWEPGIPTDLQLALPAFLDFVYNGGFHAAQSPPAPPLQCDFISLHAKGDWTGLELPNLSQSGDTGVGVIYTVESTVSEFTSSAKYEGYFDGKPIVNTEADMRVGFEVPFYPRMIAQFPAWLTALMIASDSLTSEYAPRGVQFVSASDNAHPELVGWQEPANPPPGSGLSSGSVSGGYAFGQQRSIMTAASSWDAGTTVSPICPQDLVKVPVYNFYELLRLLGDQHGVFVSGQENFYPTDPNSNMFSAITVGAPSGELTHVCWVFCVYPTNIPKPADLTKKNNPFNPPIGSSAYVEVIGLPATWQSVNWVQFQIGQASENLPDRNSFTAAGGNSETVPSPVESGGIWEYYVSDGSGTGTQLSLSGFDAGQVRMNQELGLVQYMRNVSLTNGAWESPVPVDFEPYSATVFWITPYEPAATPATPPQPVATLVATSGRPNVVITWQYPPSDPNDPSFDPTFFCFEVFRNGTLISPPMPTVTQPDVLQWSFALRATMWVDTAVKTSDTGYTYSIVAWNSSGTQSDASPDSASVVVP